MNFLRKSGLSVAFTVMLAVLALASCGKKEEPAIDPTAGGNMGINLPAERGKEDVPAPSSAAEPGALDAIAQLIDEGRCYEAFREMLLFEEKNRDPASIEACEALYERLEPLVRENEPVSGTELGRTFRYYGGCELLAAAKTGPLLITVTEADAEGGAAPAYACFYVRRGETAGIHLPAGVYRVSYQVGYLWFGDEIGFGDYWTGGELEQELIFEFSSNGSVSTNSRYTLTF